MAEAKPGGFAESDTKAMDKIRADQKKKDEEADKKMREDRDKERQAAVEHGSILDEEMAKRLDEQDEKEKKYEEEQAEKVRAGRDVRQSQQAGNIESDKEKASAKR